LDIIIKNELR